jgi:class 3 adenylate cyclase
MYAFEVSQTGSFQRAFTLTIRTDLGPSSREYKRLVDWDLATEVPHPYTECKNWMAANFQGLTLEDLPAGRTFLSVPLLTAYCKRHGVTLFATSGGFPMETHRPAAGGFLKQLRRTWFIDLTTEPDTPSGIRPQASGYWVPDSVYDQLNSTLDDEDQEVRWISSLGVERTFVYLDITGFSKEKPGMQNLIITSLLNLINRPGIWTGHGSFARNAFEAIMCTGDGFIFVFRDAVEGTYFAAYLANLIEVFVALESIPEFHFRMGIHAGPVFTFWDPGRRDWNYIGEGINGGQRVLDIDKTHDDIIHLSDSVRRLIRNCTSTRYSEAGLMVPNMRNRGRHKDKHDRYWRVFELNHNVFCPGVFDEDEKTGGN